MSHYVDKESTFSFFQPKRLSKNGATKIRLIEGSGAFSLPKETGSNLKLRTM